MKKSNIKVLIRCDGDHGKKNGMGHIYRSIEVAKFLKKKYEVIFLTKSSKTIENFLAKKIRCRIVNISKFNRRKLERYFTSNSVLVNDTFGKDKKINLIAEKKKSKIICFDDNNINFKKGLLINAITHYRNRKKYPKNIKYFGGFKYLVLRNLKKKKVLNTINSSFFVSSGGADIHNFLYKISKILLKINPKQIKVMVGYGVKKNNKIYGLARENKNIKLLKNINNPVKYMLTCKYVIVTGGTVCFEAVASGCKTICIQNYNHQVPASKYLEKKNLIHNFGLLNNINQKKLLKFFQKKKYDNKYKNNNTVDFNGIKRLKVILNNFLNEKNPNYYSG